MLTTQEPIRLIHAGTMRAAAIPPTEAQRQFRMSLVLVTLLAFGSLTATLVTLTHIG